VVFNANVSVCVLGLGLWLRLGLGDGYVLGVGLGYCEVSGIDVYAIVDFGGAGIREGRYPRRGQMSCSDRRPGSLTMHTGSRTASRATRRFAANYRPGRNNRTPSARKDGLR